ncbi:MAG: chemotaxis protein CheA, partial [Anaerolineales bacterium]
MSDFSMFDLFRMEIEGQTALLSKDLLELEHNTGSDQLLESVMRASHSIKGAARMVSVEPVVEISHVMEDCFVSAQKKNIVLTNDDIDYLLRAVDTIIEISKIDETKISEWSSNHENDVAKVIASLTAILQQNKNTQLSEGNYKRPHESPDTTIYDKNEDRFLRISAERMSKILGMSSELLVESREVKNFSSSLLQIKRRQDDLAKILESLRGLLPTEDIYDAQEIHKNALIRLDECRTKISRQLVLLDEFDRKNSNLSNKLYGEVAGSRMRPFGDGVSGFGRMVRDLARSLGKEITLKINGLDCLVDRDVLEKLKAPLNHLLRNAIDHGVELIEERAALGKPKLATITLSASHAGGMLIISVSDDGQGINLVSLRKKLLSKNLVTENVLSDLSHEELMEFLFLPDFSTKDNVSEISGRGVGLDVVRDMVKELGGVVSVTSNPGFGAEFLLRLPLSLSVISALLVEISNEPYAFPLNKVDRILRISTDDITEMEGQQLIDIAGTNIGLVSAAKILGFEQPNTQSDY